MGLNSLQKSTAAAILCPPLVVLLIRILFQGLLFPTELSGDEAQYWDWSRNLQLSYYTKGPGVSLIIAFFTAWLGVDELAIRIGSYICHAISAIAVGFLGYQLSEGSKRVVWFCSIGFQCILGYQLGGSLMTVDMPMIAGWTVGTSAAVAIVQRTATGASVTAPMALLGVAFGCSVLAKYTALLGLLGVLIGMWRWRQEIIRSPGANKGLLYGSLLCLGSIAPIVVWNALRGWPTIEHLLGHLSLPGGDSGTVSWSEFQFSWPLTFLLQVISLPGPLISLVILSGIVATRKERKSTSSQPWRVAAWSALPLLIFYSFVSLKASTEANWTAAAAAPLIPFAASWFDAHWNRPAIRYLAMIIGLRSVITWSLFLTLPWSVPLISQQLKNLGIEATPPLHRIQGHRNFADEIDRLRTKIEKDLQTPIPMVCDYYDRTALMAFYSPNRPTVYCASMLLGARPSAYDDIQATRFDPSDWQGQDLILIGADIDRWRAAIDISEIEHLATLPQRGRKRQIFHARMVTTTEKSPR